MVPCIAPGYRMFLGWAEVYSLNTGGSSTFGGSTSLNTVTSQELLDCNRRAITQFTNHSSPVRMFIDCLPATMLLDLTPLAAIGFFAGSH